MKCFISILVLTIITLNLSAQQFEYISKENLKKKVEYLSSKELAGRLPGTEGYNKAAEFSAEIFQEAGLKPFGDSAYYQFLEVESNEILEPIEFTLINDEREEEFVLGDDFIFRGFTGNGNIEKEVVFCGYGISRPDLNYDDYSGIDVNDKIVMVFKYNPSWKINDEPWGTNYPREKSWTAFKHGAKGIIFISFPNDKSPQEHIGSVLHGSGKQINDFPQLHASLNSAAKFFKDTKHKLTEVQTIIDSTKSPLSFNLNTKARIQVTSKYQEKSKTMNIVGLIEGSDDKLKNEFIVIGAHLDHVGQQGKDIYFPGANDNASGSAAVLSIAQEISKMEVKPKRSIIFVLFASEEQGLFGAEHFVKKSPVPIESISAMINMDCVGYGDSIQIGNGKSSPILWEIAYTIDSKNNDMMVERTWSGGGADAAPFHDAGIPALYFVTTNSYEHLHKITDTAETLNYDLYYKLTKLALLTLIETADNYEREIVK